MRVLLAAFYSPGIMALQTLFAMGIRPGNVRLLTHAHWRNGCLLEFAALNRVEAATMPAASSAALQWAREFSPDVLLSLYYREIVPRSLLGLPGLGCVNLHPALLPQYRGTFSAPHAIINGERYTGFTYHYMVEAVDAGNIILQQQIAISPADTAYSLYHRSICEGLARLPEVMRLVTVERFPGRPQPGNGSHFARKLPWGGRIDPHWSREQVERFIRAMYFPPFTGAVIEIDGQDHEVNSIEEYDALTAEVAR